MLRDSVAAAAAVVVVVRTRPRAIPLAMITMRKINSWVSVAFLYVFEYGAPLDGPRELRYNIPVPRSFQKSSVRNFLIAAPAP